MGTSRNRTKWPVKGGAVSFQPGWFPGHKTAYIYINLGLGTIPENMSLPMLSPFQLSGPSNDPYPGTFCMPQVPLPANIEVKAGDNATIQLIETAGHGAALYNVSDTFETFNLPIRSADLLLIWYAVRRHHIRRAERSRRSDEGQLFQFQRPILPVHCRHGGP